MLDDFRQADGVSGVPGEEGEPGVGGREVGEALAEEGKEEGEEGGWGAGGDEGGGEAGEEGGKKIARIWRWGVVHHCGGEEGMWRVNDDCGADMVFPRFVVGGRGGGPTGDASFLGCCTAVKAWQCDTDGCWRWW